ncbi:MAG TPA: hypothetical protein DCR40_21325 [Prolixibacteraceae bacterium]|nr:hypothetical protein [Prolixibacteraceae bacterium]
MKTFISLMILMIALIVTLPPGNQVHASNLSDQNSFVVNNHQIAPAALTQEEGGIQAEPEQTNVEEEVSENFLLDNWGALLMGLLGSIDLVARLTPTEKDNSIVNFLMTLFNAIIPNFRKGGGSFKLLSK